VVKIQTKTLQYKQIHNQLLNQNQNYFF